MPRPSRSTPAKRPFDLEVVLRRVRAAVAGYADAAMFALRDGGYGTLFQQLVGCIISIRTRDETSLPVARQLFDRAPTPAAVAALSVESTSIVSRIAGGSCTRNRPRPHSRCSSVSCRGAIG